MKIIRFNLIDDPARKTKVECSIEIGGFHINGLRLVERNPGEMVLSFPFWKDRGGETHEIVYATDEELYKTIGITIFNTYKSSSGREGLSLKLFLSEKEKPLVVSLGDDLLPVREINLKLKNQQKEPLMIKIPRRNGNE